MSLYLIAFAALSPPAIVAPPPAPPARVVRLPRGTRVPVMLAHGVSAKTAKAGDRVILRTLAPVAFKGNLVVPEGSLVEGEVERATLGSGGGRPGEIVISASAIMLEAGGRIPLDGALTRDGVDYRRSIQGGAPGGSGASLQIPLGRRNATPNLEAGTAFFATTARDF